MHTISSQTRISTGGYVFDGACGWDLVIISRAVNMGIAQRGMCSRTETPGTAESFMWCLYNWFFHHLGDMALMSPQLQGEGRGVRFSFLPSLLLQTGCDRHIAATIRPLYHGSRDVLLTNGLVCCTHTAEAFASSTRILLLFSERVRAVE
jgi:hypothetical protein